MATEKRARSLSINLSPVLEIFGLKSPVFFKTDFGILLGLMQSCLLAGIKKSGTTPENFQLFLKICCNMFILGHFRNVS
jgi:hypothetical protein